MGGRLVVVLAVVHSNTQRLPAVGTAVGGHILAVTKIVTMQQRGSRQGDEQAPLSQTAAKAEGICSHIRKVVPPPRICHIWSH
jgi:hypothetical protein